MGKAGQAGVALLFALLLLGLIFFFPGDQTQGHQDPSTEQYLQPSG